MSVEHEINKISGDMRRMINQIASHGMMGPDGSVIGTKKTVGYVCAIHEEGELAGTIDVQEYNYEPEEYQVKGAGHHSGVLLSAIQNNDDGFLIVPLLFSEVVIVMNPLDRREYVIMYSHAQSIKCLAHATKGEDKNRIEIGVFETEDFIETDEGLEKGFDELEPTKNKANTIYKATSITDQVVSPEDEEGCKQEMTAEHKVITVGDTKIVIDGQNVNIETSGNISFTIGDTKITKDNSSVKIETQTCEIKGTDVTITGGNLKTKGLSNTDLNGPFNAVKVCPFSGAPHCGSQVSGT